MTNQNDNDDPNYKVGFGKPPLHSRYKKGQTGNPRGSRPKMERSRSMVQLRKDFLSIAEQSISIMLDGKQKSVSGFQATVLKLQQLAIKGDKHAMKLYFQMEREFMHEFTQANPDVSRIVEGLDRHLMQQPDSSKAEDIVEINKLHRRTRGLNQ